jgi:hypothetical protein
MCVILQRGVGKHPQGIYLRNSNDHGAYPCWGGADYLIPVGGWLPMNILGSYLVFKRELRKK